MKCFYCNAEVRWNNDYDTEDTYPDSEHTIVSMYNCDECDTWYLYHATRLLVVHTSDSFLSDTLSVPVRLSSVVVLLMFSFE